MRRPGFQVYGRIIILCMLAVLLFSCESGDKYVGVYRAEATGPAAAQGAIIIELRANGEGVWKAAPDGAGTPPVEVPFSWYIKEGSLRINTKEGGVIVGKIKKDTIELMLPGPKTLTFKKTL